MNNLKEKRQHTRRKQNKLVTLESLQVGIDENARMVNCSDSGLSFESDQVLQPGSDIFIRITDDPDDRTESYKCHHVKVIWGKRLINSPFDYGYGVEYVVPSKNQNSQNKDSGRIRELRKHPRRYCGKPVMIQLDNKSYKGTISDISRNGCFVENSQNLNLGQIFGLVIPGTKFSKNNSLKVEVVRLSPVGVAVKYRRIIKTLSTA